MTDTKDKLYKVISKPEGEPTFTVETVNADGEVISSVERPYMTQTVLLAPNENIAKKIVEAQNWDRHISGSEMEDLIYEVISVKEDVPEE
jgi:hypothetical protein